LFTTKKRTLSFSGGRKFDQGKEFAASNIQGEKKSVDTGGLSLVKGRGGEKTGDNVRRGGAGSMIEVEKRPEQRGTRATKGSPFLPTPKGGFERGRLEEMSQPPRESDKLRAIAVKVN